MDQLTALIKQEIRKQFKSVRKFTAYLGLPYTTVSSALRNGIGGTSYETVMKICRALGNAQVNDQDPVLINDGTLSVPSRYHLLDGQGAHTVRIVLAMEFARCAGKPFSTYLIENGAGKPKS